MFNKLNASLIVSFFDQIDPKLTPSAKRIKLLQRICTAKKDTIAKHWHKCLYKTFPLLWA